MCLYLSKADGHAIQMKFFLTMSIKAAMLKSKHTSKGFEMKKLGLALALILIFGAGLFFWLLSQSTPEQANSETVIVDIEDKFER